MPENPLDTCYISRGNSPAGNRFHCLPHKVHFLGSPMNMNSYLRTAAFGAAMLLIALPVRLPAQTTGSIEFSARVAPTGGRPEPVRQLTFYLLRKSLDDVRAEAAQLEPDPDLEDFIDSLKVSPELK